MNPAFYGWVLQIGWDQGPFSYEFPMARGHDALRGLAEGNKVAKWGGLHHEAWGD